MIQHKFKGFTLVELLLYISIVSVVILVMSGVFYLVLQARVKNQTVAEVEQTGAQVMQQVTQTIRNANAVNSPSPGNTAASISLSVVDAAKDPTTFDLSSASIRIAEGTSPSVALTSSRLSASNLTFQNLARAGTADTIRIQFTLSHINPQGQNEYQYQQTFYGSADIKK